MVLPPLTCLRKTGLGAAHWRPTLSLKVHGWRCMLIHLGKHADTLVYEQGCKHSNPFQKCFSVRPNLKGHRFLKGMIYATGYATGQKQKAAGF